MKKTIYFFTISFVILLGFLILKNPQICTKSVISGLLVCGKVVIPSLFPFTFCVLFILKSGILETLKLAQKTSVFLLSLIGGYPIGAKMISESILPKSTKENMLYYCINAGPAFIILAVGNGVFKSQAIGILLYFSHIIPSIIMALIFNKKCSKTTDSTTVLTPNLIDNFTQSAASSCSALISISGYVIIFFVIMGYINQYQKTFPFLSGLKLLLEITAGISSTRNIYLISFLLGFGGLCVWFQIFAISKGLKINYLKFIVCRVFHGGCSMLFTYIFIKIFAVSLPVLSNGKVLEFSHFQSDWAVGISLIIMGVVFIISLSEKNFTGNIIKDLI